MNESSTQDAQAEIELVAKLIGSTQAELNRMDNMLVDPTTNPTRSAINWNPEAVMKGHIQSVMGEDSVASTPVVQPPEDYSPMTLTEPTPPPQPQQGFAEPIHPSVDAAEHLKVLEINLKRDYVSAFDKVLIQMTAIESRLDILTQKVDTLVTLDQHLIKSVDRGLKNKMKQITIKLNESDSIK